MKHDIHAHKHIVNYMESNLATFSSSCIFCFPDINYALHFLDSLLSPTQ
jgi:hypothetical protein